MYAVPAWTVLTGLLFSACSSTQQLRQDMPEKPEIPEITAEHYHIYTGDGQPASFEDIVEAMGTVQVVFIGETHDDPVCHVLQAQLLQAAFSNYGVDTETKPKRRVALSMEMFSRDVQYIVDEYLDSLVTENHFLSSSNPWANYETDYKPIFEFARIHGLPVIAANGPRRYTNRISREGPESLEELGDLARSFLPPLPYPGPSPAYKAKWDALMQEAMGDHSETAESDDEAADTTQAISPQMMAAMKPSTGIPNMLHAQSFWDASMAYSIAEFLQTTPDALVVHLVGGFHVEAGTGTPEQLLHYFPDARFLNIAVRPSGQIDVFDVDSFAGYGDFVILTDERLPRTF